MNKIIRFLLLSLLVMLCGTAFAQEVTLDFTSQSNWNIPTSGTNKDLQSFTDGNITIKLYATNNYKLNNGYLILGKSGSYLEFPAFDFAVEKIEIAGTSGASESVKQNIYVGDVAVSTETTGAKDVTHTYEIAEAYQAAGNIYQLNVTSSHNTQISTIKIYKKENSGSGFYTVDFNKAIATSNHDFAVASNWGHIVGVNNYDNYGPYYMTYSYKATDGFDGTGALYAARQYAGDNYGGEVCNDLLVTPKVNGGITLKVKSSGASNSYPSFVEIYKVDEAGTTMDGIVQRFTAEEGFADIEGQDDWKLVSLTLTEEQRIGIRAQYVIMDDFTAEAATIVPMKLLTVTGVMNPDKQNGTQGTNPIFEEQPDGKLKVVLKVALENTGDVDLTAGMDGFSLTPAYNTYVAGAKTYCEDATVSLTRDIAVGAVDTVDVEFLTALPETAYDGAFFNWFVRENISNTTSSLYRYAKIVLYQPKFVFRAAESSSTYSINTAQAFGLISETTTKSFEISNQGTAPLIIKSITLPEGFTSANMPVIPAEGLSIAKGTAQALDITLPATTQGQFSGNLVIVYLDKEGAEQTYTLAFSGNVLPAGTWAADFNSEGGSVNYPAGSIAEGGITYDYQYSEGTYNTYLKGRTQSSYASENNKFITPKLHATAGATLTFDVKGYNNASQYIKVYTSADRKNWGDPVAYYTYGETEGAEAIGSTFVNKSITFDEEGDYYVAFAIYGNFCLDNIIGLTKVDVAHDLYIKSVNWPDASIKSGSSQTKPSVDIIPLTNEAADAYTVKYIYGENEVNIESKELVATANSTTTFAASFTPEVETTTSFLGTKVIFEFTDGTKFETEPFDLTVTNEPKFHFVKTLPSSKWYEPTDYTTPITFGKTNAADTQTFYVYNWGSATLTVKSIVVPDGFTATPAEQFTVAPFDESDMSVAAQTVDITFSAETAGEYSGDMVITYVDATGADATFTLAVSGTKLDPTMFYANFDDVDWPAGSVYQNNISSYNGGAYNAPNYYISASGTTDNLFVTPKLSAQAGDKISFDAKLYSSYWNEGKVVVYAAATRDEVLNAEEGTTRTQLFSVSGEDEVNPLTTDYQTFEVTMPTTGEFFLGFEISNRSCVDEIYGLKTVAVEHDLMIVSSNIPAEAMQNTPSTATVNVLNAGLQEETSYDIVIHIGDEVKTIVGTEPIVMKHKLSESQAINVPVQSPKVGTFPVFIELKAGDYVVATEPVDVTFAEEVAVADAIEVGTKSGIGRDYGFVDWYNNDGSTTRYTDILYPAAKIAAAGIKAGDEIVSISFKATNDSKTFNAVVTSWVGTSTGEVTLGTPDKTNMAEVVLYNGSTVFPENFESVITLPVSVVWDGTSDIRVYTEAVGQGTGNWITAKYEYDSEITMSYNGTLKAAPLAYFTLAAEAATFVGTVKDEVTGNGLEGALVTLISKDGNNVQYAGTTDAEGKFSINVIQSSREYSMVVTKDGYVSYTSENVDLTAEPTIILCDVTTGVQELAGRHMNNGEVYNLRGQKVTGTLKKGVYIINGKKTVVK